MGRSEKAVDCFQNCNCCQAVLSVFGPEIGLSQEVCLKLGSGFGSGMIQGETCGAVTGAYMVLGMKFGPVNQDGATAAKMKKYIQHFNQQFIKEQGSLVCKELLGVNIATESGREFANSNQLFEKRCPAFVQTAVMILDLDY